VSLGEDEDITAIFSEVGNHTRPTTRCHIAEHQNHQVYVLLTVHLGSVLVNNQLDAPSSVQVWMKIQTCTLDGHLHTVTYTRCHIDTIDSPDDEHRGARNM